MKQTLPRNHCYLLQPHQLEELKSKYPWIRLPSSLTIDSELTPRTEGPGQALQLILKVNKLCPLRTLLINDASFVEGKPLDKSVKFFDSTVQEVFQNALDGRNEVIMDRLHINVVMRDFKEFAEKLAEKVTKVLSVQRKINGGLKYDLVEGQKFQNDQHR